MSQDIPDPRYSNPSASAANAIALPIFAVLSSSFLFLPFRAFYLLHNFPACSISITLWIINLSTFLNAIIWPTDDWTTWWAGYGLCDIESILRWPVTLSASSGLCCFARGLARALDTDRATINLTKSQRRRHLVIEILIIWGVPFLQIALHYIVQASRYAIVPVFGCTDSLDNSWPTLIIIIIWGPFFTIMTAYYAVVLLYRLRKHRKTISSALSTTGSGMVPRKFVKLAMVSILILIVYLPVEILFIFRSIPKYWIAYDWDRIHNLEYWSAISYYHTQDIPFLQYDGWTSISYGFILLPFYGFNDDAIRTYRRWMVILGLGRCWPSLKQPYRPRGRGGSSMTLSERSGSSQAGRFDLVGKIMQYFDTESHVSSASRGTRYEFRGGISHSLTDSRNMSFGSTAFDNSTIISGRTASISTSPLSAETHLLNISTATIPVPSPAHTRFATMRSWNPFASFSPHPPKFSSHFSTDDSTIIGEDNPFTSTRHTDVKLGANSIATNIWSPPYADAMEIQSLDDPLSPPLGSRAYRERERREMERDRAEREVSAMGGRGVHSGVVVVQTQLERKEEGNGQGLDDSQT